MGILVACVLLLPYQVWGFVPHFPRIKTSFCHSCRPKLWEHVGPLAASTMEPPIRDMLDEADDGDDEVYGDGEAPSVMDFVQMVTDAPPGSIGADESSLMRDVMWSIAEENADYKETPTIVTNLLNRMMEEWDATNDKEVKKILNPMVADFALVFDLWRSAIHVEADAKARNTDLLPEAVSSSRNVYMIMEDLYDNGMKEFKPTKEIAESFLYIVSSSRERGVDRLCRKVFDDLTGKYDVEISMSIYHSLIVALAKSRDRGAAHRAETFLREAAKEFPPSLIGGTVVGIGVETFNVVLTAWAKSSLDYGPERAEKLIYFMDELDQNIGGEGLFKPSVSSFTSLLDAYAQKLDWESVSQAEVMFNRLLDEFLERKDPELEPNIATWTIVLSAWAKLARKNNRGAPARANRLMDRMESLHNEGRISFGPDAIVFTSTLNAWAFSKTVEGPQRSTEILQEMYERYMDGDDTMKPSVRNIRNVIEAWTNSEDADSMNKAEAVLDAYEDHLDVLRADANDPEAVDEAKADIYRTMLFGWTKKDDPERAMDYLLDMIDGNLKVDSFCFDRVIESNSRLKDDAGAFARSQQVFDLMRECEAKELAKPNERAYNSFMRAMVKAKVPQVAPAVLDMLNEMQALYEGGNEDMQPTTFCMNTVLLACASTAQNSDDPKEKAQAFKIAIRVFKQLRNGRGDQALDNVSFGNLLQCSELLPEGDQKDSLIRSTFSLCCKAGFLNNFVLRDFKAVISDELLLKMLKCSSETELDISMFPAAWSRNVQMKQKKSEQDKQERRPRGGDRRRR